jgi:hypothetical protein
MTNVKLKCAHCNIDFEFPLKFYNFQKKKNKTKWFCSKSCYNEDIKPKIIEKKCLYCNQVFLGTTKSKSTNFCKQLCSKRYSNSFVDREQVSNTLKNYFKNNPKIKKVKEFKNKCLVCNTIFISQKYSKKTCSSVCFTKRLVDGGKSSASVQSNNRRSKNEIYFSELCKSKFEKVLLNEPMFNGWDADVILITQKIAILWNGKWHYEKITKKHSVEQVQNRDKIKLDEIKKSGYDSYVIKDLGKFNKKFVEIEFEKFNEWLRGRMTNAPLS